ncbi:hypothetical protein BVJ53_08940 [Lacticaseibacillus chiayiensis]|uniref:Uncharacterized protein n=1 Tax=Lacticaseibacillus chiayiensis TaxID=2100821 RepID=A0A4Q1TW30_9LACO|nr:hypothetical protein BVJ53_08940 [Lacticaseibacillus chiayiensis]
MALGVMAGLWPLRPRSLHGGFCASERVFDAVSASVVPYLHAVRYFSYLRPRPLHAGFCAGERVSATVSAGIIPQPHFNPTLQITSNPTHHISQTTGGPS